MPPAFFSQTSPPSIHGIFHTTSTYCPDGSQEEPPFIALGDFNQDCSYASASDFIDSPIETQYVYIVPDSADTNVSTSSECAYDRIVITPDTEAEFTGEWGMGNGE